MRDVEAVAFRDLGERRRGALVGPVADALQRTVRAARGPLRVRPKHVALIGYHVRRDPQSGLESVRSDALAQPLHPVRESLVALPIAKRALVAVVDLDVLEPERTQSLGGEGGVPQDLVFG